jgi:hypothetical protein
MHFVSDFNEITHSKLLMSCWLILIHITKCTFRWLFHIHSNHYLHLFYSKPLLYIHFHFQHLYCVIDCRTVSLRWVKPTLAAASVVPSARFGHSCTPYNSLIVVFGGERIFFEISDNNNQLLQERITQQRKLMVKLVEWLSPHSSSLTREKTFGGNTLSSQLSVAANQIPAINTPLPSSMLPKYSSLVLLSSILPYSFSSSLIHSFCDLHQSYDSLEYDVQSNWWILLLCVLTPLVFNPIDFGTLHDERFSPIDIVTHDD